MLPRSALPFIWSRVSPASRDPTQREARIRIGNVARHSSVTCQLRANIVIADHDHADRVGHHAGQHGGERALGADHVVVEAGDQRAGLGAREERQRHPLHVGEHLGAQVVDQALPDPRGQPPHEHAEAGVDERDPDHGEREQGDQPTVALADAVVDEALDQERVDHHDRGVEHGDHQERGDHGAVGNREPADPAEGLAGEPGVDRAAVGAEPASAHGVHAAHGGISSRQAPPGRRVRTVRRAPASGPPARCARPAAGRPANGPPPAAAVPWCRRPRRARWPGSPGRGR